MGTLANSEDPDEMSHQGLHCLLRLNGSSENEIEYFLKVITFDPSKYTMDHPDFIVFSLMENTIGLKRFKSVLILTAKMCTFAIKNCFLLTKCSVV